MGHASVNGQAFISPRIVCQVPCMYEALTTLGFLGSYYAHIQLSFPGKCFLEEVPLPPH